MHITYNLLWNIISSCFETLFYHVFFAFHFIHMHPCCLSQSSLFTADFLPHKFNFQMCVNFEMIIIGWYLKDNNLRKHCHFIKMFSCNKFYFELNNVNTVKSLIYTDIRSNLVTSLQIKVRPIQISIIHEKQQLIMFISHYLFILYM